MADLDLDRLVSRAVHAVGNLARRGSMLTTGVGLIAFVITGAAYLVGLGAFDGGVRSVWVVLGAVLLFTAAGAPLMASYRLRAIPRHADELISELRMLIGRNDEARRVVIDTVAVDEEPATADTHAPVLLVQGGQFNTLNRIAVDAGDVPHLVRATRDLASLPSLLAIGLALTGFAAVLGFIFTLIWLF